MSNIHTGLAGEFYVLAQLNLRPGLTAALTLGNSKGIDIIVSNENSGRKYLVEVKTSLRKPSRASVFGGILSYTWQLNVKNETLVEKALIYCFVWIEHPAKMPKFFLVPSIKVAAYTNWANQVWRSRPKLLKDNGMRVFRIEAEKASKYENNWELFK